MKKVLLFLLTLLACGSVIFAQERTKIADGLFLVRYGNVAVIEDDIHQCTIQLKVEDTKQKNSYGQQLYNVFCGNEYTKGIAKNTMKYAITTMITSAATKIGAATGGVAGAAAGATVGSYISQYANSIASTFYDDVCNHFAEESE